MKKQRRFPARFPLAFGHPITLCGACILTALLTGCGGEYYEVAPVSGTITLDGQPLPNARIGFEPRRQGDTPNAGPGSYAKTDSAGRFALETLDGRSGAVVTTHDVWIRTLVAPADRSGETIEAAPEKVPARYNDATTLTFSVETGGTDQANFDLLSTPEE